MSLVVGCSDKWDKAISELDGFKDKMCACKDKACTDGVKKDMEAWETKMKDTFKKDEKPPEKLIEKGDKIEKEMRECRKTVEKAAGAEAGAAALKKMTEFKDSMCACKDSACAQKVSDDMTKWGQEQAKDVGSMPTPDEDTTKKMTDIGTKMGECMQKAMTPTLPGLRGCSVRNATEPATSFIEATVSRCFMSRSASAASRAISPW